MRTRLAAVVVTVNCPFPFMIWFLSSFQAYPGAREVCFFQVGDTVVNIYRATPYLEAACSNRVRKIGYSKFVFGVKFGF